MHGGLSNLLRVKSSLLSSSHLQPPTSSNHPLAVWNSTILLKQKPSYITHLCYALYRLRYEVPHSQLGYFFVFFVFNFASGLGVPSLPSYLLPHSWYCNIYTEYLILNSLPQLLPYWVNLNFVNVSCVLCLQVFCTCISLILESSDLIPTCCTHLLVLFIF